MEKTTFSCRVIKILGKRRYHHLLEWKFFFLKEDGFLKEAGSTFGLQS
jgi:hypothetical protein